MLTDDERTLQVLEHTLLYGADYPTRLHPRLCVLSDGWTLRGYTGPLVSFDQRIGRYRITPAGRAELDRLRKLKEVSGE